MACWRRFIRYLELKALPVIKWTSEVFRTMERVDEWPERVYKLAVAYERIESVLSDPLCLSLALSR